MPGMTHCARCQSALGLTAVNYVPPRASGGRLIRAARRSWQRRVLGTGDFMSAVRRWIRSLLSTRVDWRALAWSIIPGLGHVRADHRIFGYTMMAIWLALLAGLLAFAGSSSAWVWYLLVLGFHCFVITLLLSDALQYVSIPRRLVAGLMIYAGLTFLLYLPARWFAGNFAVPLELNGVRTTDLLKSGDTVVYTGRWMPRHWNRGDLVFYRIHQTHMTGAFVAEGFGLDRIVALGGDTVQINGGRLTVNGAEPAADAEPLRGLAGLPETLTIHVADGCFLIFPSALNFGGHGNYQTQLMQMINDVSIVPDEDIIGRVFWRLRPWTRFGSLE